MDTISNQKSRKSHAEMPEQTILCLPYLQICWQLSAQLAEVHLPSTRTLSGYIKLGSKGTAMGKATALSRGTVQAKRVWQNQGKTTHAKSELVPAAPHSAQPGGQQWPSFCLSPCQGPKRGHSGRQPPKAHSVPIPLPTKSPHRQAPHTMSNALFQAP